MTVPNIVIPGDLFKRARAVRPRFISLTPNFSWVDQSGYNPAEHDFCPLQIEGVPSQNGNPSWSAGEPRHRFGFGDRQPLSVETWAFVRAITEGLAFERPGTRPTTNLKAGPRLFERSEISINIRLTHMHQVSWT